MNTITARQLTARQVAENRKKQSAKVTIWLRVYTAFFNNTMAMK